MSEVADAVMEPYSDGVPQHDVVMDVSVSQLITNYQVQHALKEPSVTPA